jgi:hypothetical protein
MWSYLPTTHTLFESLMCKCVGCAITFLGQILYRAHGIFTIIMLLFQEHLASSKVPSKGSNDTSDTGCRLEGLFHALPCCPLPSQTTIVFQYDLLPEKGGKLFQKTVACIQGREESKLGSRINLSDRLDETRHSICMIVRCETRWSGLQRRHVILCHRRRCICDDHQAPFELFVADADADAD